VGDAPVPSLVVHGGGGNPTSTHLRTVRLTTLDGVRGLAILGVLAFHLGTADGGVGLLPGGWLGVDAFLTLSGYLVTSTLLAELTRHGRIDLVAFWRRRLRRLQPAALVVIAVTATTALWWAPGGTADSARNHAMAALAGVANWFQLWSDQPYSAGSHPSAFEHFWSLAVEEQFYVVWPLALVALTTLLRGRRIDLRRAVAALALGGTALSWLWLAQHDVQRAYLGTDTRAGAVLLGAALAALLPLGATPPAWLRRHAGALAAVGLGTWAGLWLGAGWTPRFPLVALLPLHGLASVAVIAGLAASSRSPNALDRGLAWQPLAGLGRVSYGVYLWHWPLFLLLTPERLGAHPLVTDVVRLAVLALLTTVSWVQIEEPVRRGLLFARTRVALPVAVVVVALVASGAVDDIAPLPAWATDSGTTVVETTAPMLAGRPERVLVVGDSIPTSLLSGPTGAWQQGNGHLLAHLAAAGITAAGATVPGCPVIDAVHVVDGRPHPTCPERQATRLTEAMTTVRPDLVVWYSQQESHPILHAGRPTTDPDVLAERYDDRLQWFAERGARVLLVAPGLAELDALLTRVARSHPDVVAGVVPMRELLCGASSTACADRAPDGSRFRPDGVHFDGAGEEVVSAWLAQRIATAYRP
jgi:peptidoglycan/LPS O-acetylase OafA/YrhL